MTEIREISRLALTQLWGACKMESLGMKHSSGIRATAQAKKIFGWPMNVSKKETFRRVDCLRKQVIEADADGMTFDYPVPILKK
tara:strand:- start:2109 stop:2360 length:252 start_codon:yes stop_codon:yes gene_type:complete